MVNGAAAKFTHTHSTHIVPMWLNKIMAYAIYLHICTYIYIYIYARS